MTTICAISTAPGTGGIAVIRVSGPEAITLTDKLFHGHHPLTQANGYTTHLGEFATQDELIDQVLCTVFRAPHSFTGEDMVEISCHGSRYIQQAVIHALIDAGCQLAKPGEFTKRAFLNGKMDLTEAEAVADLIASESKAEKDLAIAHLKGGVSTELKALREQLLHITSLLELELDFADHEELEFADRNELEELASTIEYKLSSLIRSFRLGNAVKNGIPVAIVGPTNAGKSTLLNALLGEDRAIVSDIPGTTRDTIEDTLIINGLQFRFIDTAGLRDTTDEIEAIGIRRAHDVAEKAEIILYVTEGEEPRIYEGKVIWVRNKADKYRYPKSHDANTIYISAKSDSLEPLKQRIYELADVETDSHTLSTTISSARHYEALVRAREAISRVLEGLQQQLSGEFVAMDLQDCLRAIGEITGEIANDEVLGNIFSKFCIGK